MTHSPTPTELLALRTAHAALLTSPDSFCDMVSTIVFALGSAQLLQSPETAAELARLRALASPLLVDDERIAPIRKRRSHCETSRFETEDERPLHTWGPSQYPGREMCQRCTTERAWAEDVTADEVVLLAHVDRLAARVAELERGQGAAGIAVHRINANGWQCEADAVTAIGIRNEVETIRRGPLEDRYVSPLHQDHKICHDLPEVPRG